MSKKLLLIISTILILIVGISYYYLNSQKLSSNSELQTSQSNIQLSELPNTWITYTSPEWNFAINHPPDLKIEQTPDGIHFSKLGPSQSTGTELYDGLSLLIFTSQLAPNKTFENFSKEEYNKIKNEPVYESVSELTNAQISTYSGYKFVATGLGASTTYFLKNEVDGYIKITDMTVEPENAERDFHETVSKMLPTLQITSSTPNSAEGAPSGSTHNLDVPKAVTTTKEFAAADLNVPVSKILVLSAHEREWNNACMGLEQEGEMCAQVITPGYEITIEANGKQKVYHTNSDGTIIKIKK